MAKSNVQIPYVGGQAVLEGVMMRAPGSFAVAVRRKDGTLQLRERAMVDSRTGVARWPLVRGLSSLVESLRLGGEALRFSAEKMEEDMLQAPSTTAGAAGPGLLVAFGLTVFALATDDGSGTSASPRSPRASSAGAGQWVMLAMAIAFFIALPQAAAAATNRIFHLGLEIQSPGFQAMTGSLKLVIVVGYLLAIRRVPDIRRVFQYHGAEHKTISAYEAGEALTVANARIKTTLHARCGTTFLVMVALVSIAVFTIIGAALPRIHTGSVVADNLVFLAEKLPFLPVLAGITFEIQRLLARYCATGPLRALLWPGFVVQKITTAEPDDAQLEVALASLRATLFRQGSRGVGGDDGRDVAFPSYEALAGATELRAIA
jgi:uncharacterized protein YqhQ